jgi:hypothetical protein
MSFPFLLRRAVRGVLGFSCLFALCSVGSVTASTMYQVSVDTSALVAGTSGLIDFQFNPGLAAATASISNFTSNGTLGGQLPPPDPNVTGTLPGTVVIANTAFFNAYTEQFTFGSSFDFLLTLNGDLSGSRFSLGIYSPGFAAPLLTVDENFVALIDITAGGTILEPVVFDQPGGLPPAATFTLATAGVPEPSTFSYLAGALVAICLIPRVRSSLRLNRS